jgi:hypothetical protein
MFTVTDIRPDLASNVLDAGKCKDSKSVLEYINAARRMLWPLGDWKGIVDDIRVNSFRGLLTLPARYDIIRRASHCGGEVQMDNNWYEFADNVDWDYVAPDARHNRMNSGGSCMASMRDLGKSFALYMQYNGQHRIIVKGTELEDKGKVIEFEGFDNLGHRKRVNMTLGSNHEEVYDSTWWRAIQSVKKPVTKGSVYVHIFNPNNSNEKIEAAMYEALDTNIQLRRYATPIIGSGLKQFFVRAKRQYHPLVDENEPVDFSVDSLIHACNAITQRRNKNNKEYVESVTLATGVLQHELKDDTTVTGGRIRMSRHNIVENLT